MIEYNQFLDTKRHVVASHGIDIPRESIHQKLFDWQKDIVTWAVKKGRCAIWLDTGLGKTYIQLEWARLLNQRTLIIAPLSVARQTMRMATIIDVAIQYARDQEDIKPEHGIYITNYEMIKNFDFSQFQAIVLDESSILKAIDGKTKRMLIDLCKDTPYRLCCTATPAPNDWTEIGNHSEFLGICTTAEMLATFFINANKERVIEIEGQTFRKKGSNAGGTEWRIKHHAEGHFFEWLASWAITMTKPSDLGYDDTGFDLPPLTIKPIITQAQYQGNQLFFTGLHGISDRVKTRCQTLPARLESLKQLVNASHNDEQWIIWAGLDAESTESHLLFSDSVEVKGSDSNFRKTESFERFQDAQFRILITKTKIGGYGMNFQNANNMVFLGINDSWESFYQAIRREWRYRQSKPVNVYVIISELEQEIYQNILRKDALSKRLRAKLIEQIKGYSRKELRMTDDNIQLDYHEQTIINNTYTAMLGDSCKRLAEIPDGSIDMTVYSPPFADLFTYTATERDLGNCKDWTEFFEHYSFIIKHLIRVTKSGRLSCVHTSDIPAMQSRDGYIGIKDFPGEVIRAHEKEGWVFYGRAYVQKNPQAQAIRIKSKALLFVQMRKDSSDSRPALIDQVLIFKRPGDNAVPITPVDHNELNNETWIEWAHGIWLGIQESDTLQYTRARGQDDEKHICPLQLGTIERCIKLYSNPGETILTPFMGIGSEAYMAIKLRRKAIGIELKPEYFKIACQNLESAAATTHDLFSLGQ